MGVNNLSEFINELESENEQEKAIVVGVNTGKTGIHECSEDTIDELCELAETAGAVVVGRVLQNKSSIDSAFYVGKGKLDEIKQYADLLEADVIIFDDELSPVQLRKIEAKIEKRIIDRTGLILDIFAQRAKSKEGRIQVELAQLKYLLPRLTGKGIELSRLGGGIGTRGPGEKKLETDRRHIRRRIEGLEKEIKEIGKQRSQLRERRKKDGDIIVSIAGYTNAGKSTLINALAASDVFVEDKLFATLDPTSRKVELSDNRDVIIIDTVGFIRKLPHHLVKAFKSTLEEIVESDIILHVADVSNPVHTAHMEVTSRILNELGAKQESIITVYNKIDKTHSVTGTLSNNGNSVYVSAQTHEGLDILLEAIEKKLPTKRRVSFFIPYESSSVISSIYDNSDVIESKHTESGTYITVNAEEALIGKLEHYLT